MPWASDARWRRRTSAAAGKASSSTTGPRSRHSCSASSSSRPGTATGVTLQPATSSPSATAWPSMRVNTRHRAERVDGVDQLAADAHQPAARGDEPGLALHGRPGLEPGRGQRARPVALAASSSCTSPGSSSTTWISRAPRTALEVARPRAPCPCAAAGRGRGPGRGLSCPPAARCFPSRPVSHA